MRGQAAESRVSGNNNSTAGDARPGRFNLL